MSTETAINHTAAAVEPQNGAAPTATPRPSAPVPAGSPPDFVANLIHAEVVGRWIEHLNRLSNPELQELVARLYPSVNPVENATDDPSGSPDGGVPPQSNGGSFEFEFTHHPGKLVLEPPGVDIKVRFKAGGGKQQTEKPQTFLPDAGVR